MSKNYFRSQLRKLGKGKEKKNRIRSAPSTSPESCTPSASPVHAQIPKPESSYSLASNSSGASFGNTTAIPRVNILEDALERKEVISITVDVQKFVAAISELKKAMEEADGEADENDSGSQESEDEDDGSQSEAEAAILAHLKDLIQVVHSCLDQYQGMQSTEIKNAATELMSSFQTCEHVCASRCPSCNTAVDMLIDAFTNSVHVFLNGDGHEPPLPPQKKSLGSSASTNNLLKGFSKSHDNLAPRYSSYMDLTQQVNEPIVDEIDQALASTEDNVDVAARYIKMRAKYHREVTAYLSKRGQIELRYHQEMLKLARKTHSAVDELKQQEECLPLVNLFLDSVDQDMRFASNCNTTYNVQVGGRVVEPLEQKTAENERVKKDLTHTWHKELKKLTDARTAMKNAKAKYQFMGQDLARVKMLLSAEPYGKQADKRKKEVADLESKWKEAEAAYKSAVAVCNVCQYQVHKSAQQSILCAYRRLVLDFDMSLKTKLETYFQLQHNFFLPIPNVMDSYLSAVQEYEVGQDFMRYIERHPKMKEEPEDYLFEELNPEEEEEEKEMPLGGHAEVSRMRSSSSSDSVHRPHPFISDPMHRAPSPQPMLAWGTSTEARARVSPHARLKDGDRTRPNSMAFLLEPSLDDTKPSRRNSEQPSSSSRASIVQGGMEVLMSKNALTHTFKRLRAPSRCRECDNYVYFNGYECETCGLACHKKCLTPLAIRCGNKRLDRKLTTFGVDFLKHLKLSKCNIPIIVTKCIKEIEESGMETHGLYRISTTKTKLEHLCQLFESGVDRVDLSDCQPHLIASCLKLYFRQLPEPIMTFSLYDEMISFAREASHVLPCNLATVSGERRYSAQVLLERLKELLSSLDYQRYVTMARLFYHLHRVSSPTHVKKNAMPASNLGIVYGPTLLRRRDNVASLALLADMTAQAKAIEILISHVHEVFTVTEQEVLRVEEVDPDEGDLAEERLVDGIVDYIEPLTKSPEIDLDDGATRTPNRTPFGTPPQRRRENISELGDVLEALQSAFPRRQSLPPLKSVPLGEIEDHPNFLSLPGSTTSQDDPFSPLRHQLRQGPPVPPSLSKTLTPVDERIEGMHKFSGDEDDDSHIRTSSTGKYRFSQISHSTSGLSNPSSAGLLGDMDSEMGSMHNFDAESVFSTGDPPRHILASSSSTENVMDDKPDTKSQEDYQVGDDEFRETVSGFMSKDKDQNSSQDSSENYYDPMSSKNVQALLDQAYSPTSPRMFASSGVETLDNARGRRHSCDPSSTRTLRVGKGGDESQNMNLWDEISFSNPSSPTNSPLKDNHHRTTAQQKPTPSTESVESMVDPPENSNGKNVYDDGGNTPLQSQAESESQNGLSSHVQLSTAGEPGSLSLTDLLRAQQPRLYDSPRQSDSGIDEFETQALMKNSSSMDDYGGEVELPDESDIKKMRSFKILYSSRSRRATNRKKKSAPTKEKSTTHDSVQMVVGIEQATDEVVTAFNYESDESDHAMLEMLPSPDTCTVRNEGSFYALSAPEDFSPPDMSKRESSRPKSGSVSPWHDKSRKIRINPLRVLKVTQTSPVLATPPEENPDDRTRMVSPEDIAAEKSGEKLKRSKSCGVLQRPNPASFGAPEPLHAIAEATEATSSSNDTEIIGESQMDFDISFETITRDINRREPPFV